MKNLEVLVRAFDLVRKKQANVFLTIVGSPTPGKADEGRYYERILNLVRELKLEDNVAFSRSVPHSETPRVYNEHDLFVNLTVTGSFDKTTLEAMACGAPVLVSNRSFREIFSSSLQSISIFEESNPISLAGKISDIISLSLVHRKELGRQMRSLVIEKHGLSRLADKIIQIL